MKRNWDIIREVLIKVEGLPSGEELRAEDLNEKDYDSVIYNMGLLLEANLVRGIDVSSHSGMSYILQSLTWNGHEFLDTIRNDTIWNETKEEIVNKGAGMSFDLLKALAIKLGSAYLGI